jgi:hypothetical protein
MADVMEVRMDRAEEDIKGLENSVEEQRRLWMEYLDSQEKNRIAFEDRITVLLNEKLGETGKSLISVKSAVDHLESQLDLVIVYRIKEQAKILEDHKGRIENIEEKVPALWTRDQHEKCLKECEEKKTQQWDRRERRKMSKRELVNYIITALLAAALLFITILKG